VTSATSSVASTASHIASGASNGGSQAGSAANAASHAATGAGPTGAPPKAPQPGPRGGAANATELLANSAGRLVQSATARVSSPSVAPGPGAGATTPLHQSSSTGGERAAGSSGPSAVPGPSAGATTPLHGQSDPSAGAATNVASVTRPVSSVVNTVTGASPISAASMGGTARDLTARGASRPSSPASAAIGSATSAAPPVVNSVVRSPRTGTASAGSSERSSIPTTAFGRAGASLAAPSTTAGAIPQRLPAVGSATHGLAPGTTRGALSAAAGALESPVVGTTSALRQPLESAPALIQAPSQRTTRLARQGTGLAAITSGPTGPTQPATSPLAPAALTQTGSSLLQATIRGAAGTIDSLSGPVAHPLPTILAPTTSLTEELAPTVTPVATTLQPTVRLAGGAVANLAAPVTQPLAATVAPVATTLEPTLNIIGGSIESAIAPTAQPVVTAVAPVIALVQPTSSFATGTLERLAAPLTEPFAAATGPIGAAIQPAKSGLAPVSDLTEPRATATGPVNSVVGTALSLLGDRVGAVTEPMRKPFTSALAPVAELAQQSDALGQQGITAVDGVAGAVQDVLVGLEGGVETESVSFGGRPRVRPSGVSPDAPSARVGGGASALPQPFSAQDAVIGSFPASSVRNPDQSHDGTGDEDGPGAGPAARNGVLASAPAANPATILRLPMGGGGSSPERGPGQAIGAPQSAHVAAFGASTRRSEADAKARPSSLSAPKIAARAVRGAVVAPLSPFSPLRSPVPQPPLGSVTPFGLLANGDASGGASAGGAVAILLTSILILLRPLGRVAARTERLPSWAFAPAAPPG